MSNRKRSDIVECLMPLSGMLKEDGVKALFNEDETLYYNVIAGIIAGAVSSAICNPTDVLKIRMQAEYQSGASEGVGPQHRELQLLLESSFQFMTGVKKKILDYKVMGDNPYTHFCASGVAGLAGAVASNPIDVVKTRMMNQRNLKVKPGDGTVIYTSAAHCLITTFKSEGIFALYRGFVPQFFEIGCTLIALLCFS
ncbi:hypothetical protein OS493_031860 [Desmophyllum pertusum]|uniref:Uncharacterized protein n=1 Tax=Desmophyllum pertusum TaxID=174260 RepID=A0A9W9Y8A7_9CNID|nr:hypothetical protein OS493_031860 [Desmophyllum pertusum]